MEGYNENVDYKRLHLEWIKANRGFRPQRGLMLMYNNYLDEMTAIYGDGTIKLNTTAYMYLRDDYNWSKKSKSINEEVAVMFGDKPENHNPTFFVTFNWSDENFKRDKVLDGLRKLFAKSWIDNARAVFEYNTEKGNHPHLMMLIQVNKHKTIGRFSDKIFQSSLASTLAKNFIDIKIGRPYHIEYMDLDKRPEKQMYLDADKIWRSNNGFAEEYKKE